MMTFFIFSMFIAITLFFSLDLIQTYYMPVVLVLAVLPFLMAAAM